MKLSPNQIDTQSLTQFGKEALALLEERNFTALVNKFGYALAYGRNLAEAIENDFVQCIAEVEEISSNVTQSIQVKYFNPNEISLYALVECVISFGQKEAVLVELIVTGKEQKHITLEQISYATFGLCRPHPSGQGQRVDRLDVGGSSAVGVADGGAQGVNGNRP